MTIQGGNLEELADMALRFLDTYMPRHAPRWLRYDDGALPAAFAFLVTSPHGRAARQWLRTLWHEDSPASTGGAP